ncbi:MAG: hypothetical protein AB7G23_21535 [Vicinamibacterales bacterium]
MPENDTVTTTEAPAISLRTSLVLAGQMAATADANLAEALACLDLGGDAAQADQMVASALTELNAAIRQIRAFKTARSAGAEFDRPAVYAIDGGQLRTMADLYTLYGATDEAGFARRFADESDLRMQAVVLDDDEQNVRAVRIEARPPASEQVYSREIGFPFTRAQWGAAVAAVETEVFEALEALASPERPAAPEAADGEQAVGA